MQKIYLDHAATSFPKPNCVTEAMVTYMTKIGMNMNRGAYESAYSVADVVYETRTLLCELFDFDVCENVVLTQNITYALNMIIKGLFKRGDHVLVSAMEHNAVMRPLVQLQAKGIEYSRIPCTTQGELCMEYLPSLIQENTKAIIMTAASNVCGTHMPLEEVGEFCKAHGILFIVDTAQMAGVFPISMKAMNIDVLAFTGHKGLLGPQGVGGFLVRSEVAHNIEPLITGGTGSISDSEETPNFLPDKFEAGTLNLPAIFGLHASLLYIKEIGLEEIQRREKEQLRRLLDGLHTVEGIRLIGKDGVDKRSAVVSIQCDFMDEAELAFLLDYEFGIMTRVGMHCAPNAHKTLGTFPRGTVRISLGHQTTKEEIHQLIHALQQLQRR